MEEIESRAKQLLVIDDEKNMRHMLTRLLEKSGYTVDTASDGNEGLDKVAARRYDFILCDLRMPNCDGLAFLASARAGIGDTTVIMMSAYGTIDAALEAMKLGAYDFISKPFKSDEVLLALKKAEERESLKKENHQLKAQLQDIESSRNFGNMVAKSKRMQSVFNLSAKAAQYNTTVLISGESGTGKELIARGIHYSGARANMPLIAVNCGGIPENLLESELFGHKKGAFTSADQNKKGLFEEAHGGTIFLDEIGELPLSLQVKLLRVLQEDEIRPLGESKTRKIDVRIIAATAKDLRLETQKGSFREDLYYRLNVLLISLPSLRDRAEDIPLLIQHFIRKFNKKLNREITAIAPPAMSLLLKHGWPGNVRELENVIERAVVLTENPVIGPDHLPPDLGMTVESGYADSAYDGFSLKAAQKVYEKRLIVKALSETGGNRTRAAKLLEISHPSLLSKIKRYHISL